MSSKIFYVDDTLVGARLDQAIAAVFNENSRTHAANQIKGGFVTVDGEVITKPSFRVSNEQEIEVGDLPLQETKILPENIPLDIIYEDDDLVIINKPAGMVVHPGAGHTSGTLVNALIYHFQTLSNVNGLSRPGIVHRLDKDTSGLLVVCKNDYAHNYIAAQLADRSMGRKYYALVTGTFNEEEGKIIAPLARDVSDRFKIAVDTKNGKEAITNFKVLRRFSKHTLVEAELITGRTHQIRVHFDYIYHPIDGDPLYGLNNSHVYQGGQLLHAHEISFIHPRSKEKLTFSAPVPPYFQNILDNLD